jgi:hypothetical protein
MATPVIISMLVGLLAGGASMAIWAANRIEEEAVEDQDRARRVGLLVAGAGPPVRPPAQEPRPSLLVLPEPRRLRLTRPRSRSRQTPRTRTPQARRPGPTGPWGRRASAGDLGGHHGGDGHQPAARAYAPAPGVRTWPGR